MAETRNQSEQKSTGQAIARQDREGRGIQRPQPFGTSWNSPFDFFDRMSQEMDQMFDRMTRGLGYPGSMLARNPLRASSRQGMQGIWSPRIEAVQKGDRFVVRAELPGLKKEDVQVELTEDAISIHGERREEREEEREGYYHSEREYGQFQRTIPLPEGVIGESAQASFRDGVLEISMQAPPAEATRGRRLEIKDTPAEPKK
jgi:HSP20 family protein